jgi:hypothetical protein
MCRSQAEGGQRCYRHTRTRLATREAAYAGSGMSGDLRALVEAHVDHASTRMGRAEATAHRDAGHPGPGGLPNSYWQQIIDQGEALQQRNAMMAQIARDIHPRAEAADVAGGEPDGSLEEFRQTYPDLPGWVTDSARLDQFLAGKYNDVSLADGQAVYAEAARYSAAQMYDRLGINTVYADATFASGGPRTEAERIEWRRRLSAEMSRWGDAQRQATERAVQGRTALGAFGRTPPSQRTTLDATAPDQIGYVGTIVKRNGERSAYARMVTGVNPDGTVRTLVLKPMPLPGGSPWAARLSDQAAYRSQYETYPIERLVPADPEDQTGYSGRRPVQDGQHPDHLYLASASDRARVDFDEWRLEQVANGGRPYPDVTTS